MWQATRTLRIAGSLTRRRQDDSPFIIRAVPNETAYLRADWAFLPKWNWNLQANWTGKRPLPAGDTRQAAHTLVDTTLRYFHGSEWEFAASIHPNCSMSMRANTPAVPSGYLPLPRRNFFAEVRYKF
jgi:outer membrane receptor protein involved in Fe transport